MKAKVTERFRGRVVGSQRSTTYKPGDIVEGEIGRSAVKHKRAVEVSAEEARRPAAGKAAPANKADAAAPSNKESRDPRAPAMQPAPVKPK